jgi:hypothetical protein
MMRSNKTPYSVLKYTVLLLLLCSFKNNFAQYKISDIIESNKIHIAEPYLYDGFLMNEFNFDLINKDIHAEFVAFKKQKYNLVFCTSGFEESVKISIYDKAAPSVVVVEKTMDADNKNWTFAIDKAATYSIVYEVPPSNTDVEHKACVVMLISFSMK